MHADHHTGLMPLLWARACAGVAAGAAPAPLLICGPPQLARLLATHTALVRAAMGEAAAQLGESGLAGAGAAVAAALADGRVPLATFIPPAAFEAAAVQAHAPTQCGTLRLVAFASVRVEHSCRDAFGAVLTLAPACCGGSGDRCACAASPRTVLAYSGDTVPCAALSDAIVGAAAVAGADVVLVHEATMDDARAGDAAAKRHSTVGGALAAATGLAARLAAAVRPARLVGTILTHFSQRYPSAPEVAAGGGGGAAERCLFAFDLLTVPLRATAGAGAWPAFDRAAELSNRAREAMSGRSR